MSTPKKDDAIKLQRKIGVEKGDGWTEGEINQKSVEKMFSKNTEWRAAVSHLQKIETWSNRRREVEAEKQAGGHQCTSLKR